MVMLLSKDVTFVIPTFRLDEHRLSNLRFILPYIIKTGCKVVIVEQLRNGEIGLTKTLEDISSNNVGADIEYATYYSDSELINKSAMINLAINHYVNTEYAWVNDVDFYMKFANVFSEEISSDFVQPYSVGKKLCVEDSIQIKSGSKFNVSYDDKSAQYISLYGALSFVVKRSAFIDVGGMDEKLEGWGKEDIDFDDRVKKSGKTVQVLSHKGIHLWHPIFFHVVGTKSSNFSKDMAIVTCHFNWCGYKNPVRNLNRFLNQMEIDDIPVYGVELSLSDSFVTRNRPNWKQIKVQTQNVCFQKEACINLVEKLVPKEYTKIAWIDTDLHFTNKNWYKEASEKLESYKLIQLFVSGLDTNDSGEVISEINGIVSKGGPKRERGYFGYPGGAWAARRDMWKNGGLYPYSFMGTGDTIFVNTVYDVPLLNPTEDLKFQKYLNWKSKIQSYLNKDDISHISGSFIHEWHGDKNERGYSIRNEILSKVDFDESVFLDKNGLIQLENVPQVIYDDILFYFSSRKEDGVEKIKPPIQDMAIVTVHFNWANFETPTKNLHRFILEMESNSIPLYGVELSLTGKFETEEYANWIKIKVKKENICFQKEACINLLEKMIPEKYTKIAWVDHDIYFKNRNWYTEASQELNHYKVIQLFSKEIFTNKVGREVSTLDGLMSVGGPKAEAVEKKYIGTPGAALAARRDLWKDGAGLFPYSFMGGGDTVFLYSIYGILSNSSMLRACGYNKKFKPYMDWKELTMKYVGESCSFIDGEIVHYWHGETKNRKYTDRHVISDGVVWSKALTINKNGVLEIVKEPEKTYQDIMSYFKNREEDGGK